MLRRFSIELLFFEEQLLTVEIFQKSSKDLSRNFILNFPKIRKQSVLPSLFRFAF